MNLWQRQLRLNISPSYQLSATSMYIFSIRSFYSSPPHYKKKRGIRNNINEIKKHLSKKYRNIIVYDEDLDKMPSDVEIAKKGLPKNTPTLGERLNRDVYRLFHQDDEKHGYHNLRQQGKTLNREAIEQVKHDLQTRPWQSFKEQFQVVRGEIKQFEKEVKHSVTNIHKVHEILPRPGERKKEWGFQTTDEINKWIVTRDSDWGEGYSAAEFQLSPLGHGVFNGELSTRVPADGRTQNAGYVNISSVPRSKSFAREDLMEDWEMYTHLTMNVRGDGRKYMLNIQVKRDFDVIWNDRWHYPLFTRGGPYWQYVKIPWSKFYLGSRGTLQDKQYRVPLLFGVVGMSITLMDGKSGPFQLELKDISLHHDPNYDEEFFAYETYKLPHFWAGQ